MFTKDLFEGLDRANRRNLKEAKRFAYNYQNYDDGDPSWNYRRINRNYANQGNVSNFQIPGNSGDYNLPDDEQTSLLQQQKGSLGEILKAELQHERSLKKDLETSLEDNLDSRTRKEFMYYIKRIDSRIEEILFDLNRMYSDTEEGFVEENLEESWLDDVDPTTDPGRVTGVHKDSPSAHSGGGYERRADRKSSSYQVSPEERDRLYKKNIELWKSQGRDPKTFPAKG